MSDKTTQRDLVLEFYRTNPDRDIEHKEAVDWLTAEYLKRTKQIFRDPDRQIRSLHQEGMLTKIKTGVYRYDPKAKLPLDEFTQEEKNIILKRDNYKCSVCGKGEKDGMSLHIDHIKPRDKGGKSILDNGQVLCSKHNFKKKNYNQTETGKKMFINLHRLATSTKDDELIAFCKDVLKVYDTHKINGHIKWKDDSEA